MKALSLFTGYGGIDLALKEYVSETIGYCEIERYCQGIIASRIADGLLEFAPIYPDVTRIRGNLGDCEIIFGGFPCQDLSVAGLGKGLAGERSGLFYEVIRLTKEIRPKFVFLENVPAIRTRGLRQVVGTFTEMGYDCRWTCVSASSVGAPHKRERWFLLAYSSSEGLERQRKKSSRIEKKFQDFSNNSWWKIEPNVGRMVDGCPSRNNRIKALGNGVVPAQVKKAFEILIGKKAEAPQTEKESGK